MSKNKLKLKLKKTNDKTVRKSEKYKKRLFMDKLIRLVRPIFQYI